MQTEAVQSVRLKPLEREVGNGANAPAEIIRTVALKLTKRPDGAMGNYVGEGRGNQTQLK